MANQKLTDRALYASTLVDADLIHVVDVSDTVQDAAGSSYKLQLSQLKTYLSPSFWSVLGNSGTNPSTNFIGTTDSQDFVIRTNNTEKVRITSGGFVGINGTPDSGIHLRGNTSSYAKIKVNQSLSSSQSTLELNNNNEDYLRAIVYGTTVTLDANHNFIDAQNGTVGASKGLYLYSLGSTVSKGIFFFTGSTSSSSQRMEINHNGFIGMNVSSVNNQLLTINGTSTSSSHYSLVVHNSTGSNNSLIVRNDGLIGIGTDTPNKKLHILGSTNTNAYLRVEQTTDTNEATIEGRSDNGNTTSIRQMGSNVSTFVGLPWLIPNASVLGSNSNAGLWFYNSGNEGIHFSVGNGSSTPEFMTIKPGGAVGIGTSTPSSNSLLELSSTNRAFIIMRMTATQASAITAENGMMLYVSDTNGTFTSIGVWAYENGTWNKL
jgi:hypothetical protein